MRLPYAKLAIVPQRKLTEYLLSATHRVGRAKAAFFASFGFTLEGWKTLADALRLHALEHEVKTTEKTPFGMNYVVEGPLRVPDGRTPWVRVVWFVETDEAIPRLATAYPLKGAEK